MLKLYHFKAKIRAFCCDNNKNGVFGKRRADPPKCDHKAIKTPPLFAVMTVKTHYQTFAATYSCRIIIVRGDGITNSHHSNSNLEEK